MCAVVIDTNPVGTDKRDVGGPPMPTKEVSGKNGCHLAALILTSTVWTLFSAPLPQHFLIHLQEDAHHCHHHQSD